MFTLIIRMLFSPELFKSQFKTIKFVLSSLIKYRVNYIRFNVRIIKNI